MIRSLLLRLRDSLIVVLLPPVRRLLVALLTARKKVRHAKFMNTQYITIGTVSGISFGAEPTIITRNGMLIEISGNEFRIGFDQLEERQKAEDLGRRLARVWAYRNRTHVEVNFDRFWHRLPTGEIQHIIELSGVIQSSGDVRAVLTVQRSAPAGAVLESVDPETASVLEDLEFAEKASRDATLERALQHLNDEVLGQTDPRPGIFKAIELLIHHLGNNDEGKGRTRLAALAQQKRSYVDDLQTTANSPRHSPGTRKFSKPILSIEECIERTRKLIRAYADSLSSGSS